MLGKRPPTGLSVELVDAGDEEFAIFEWSAEAAPAATLTATERAVLALVVEGASNRDIAKQRGVAVRTVANQVASLLKKLGASSRFDLRRRFGG